MKLMENIGKMRKTSNKCRKKKKKEDKITLKAVSLNYSIPAQHQHY